MKNPVNSQGPGEGAVCKLAATSQYSQSFAWEHNAATSADGNAAIAAALESEQSNSLFKNRSQSLRFAISSIKWNSCCQQQLKMDDEDLTQCGLPLCPASVLRGKEGLMRIAFKSAEISNVSLN